MTVLTRLDSGTSTSKLTARSASAASRRGGRALVLAAAYVSLGLATSSPASAAAAQVDRIATTATPIADTGLPDDCRPGISGTLSGTEGVSYQVVTTDNGREVHGTTVDTIRIDWSDGTYTLGGSTDRFSFHANVSATEFTNAHEDEGDTYAADGTLLFRSTFHLVEHFTVSDGVLRVQFDRGHLHFFGDC